MNKFFSVYLFCFFCSAYYSQIKPSFIWPIDTSHVIISSNYGQLRPNHFHAGIDFSTLGKTGLPVYAVADGYVSRIKISSGAYGKAVYITHASGNTLSLYAHFSAYAEPLATYIKQEQVKQQAYEIELFPTKNEFRFKKGDLIGYSGNSGNSTGPHLHFEIRDQVTEIPLNPLHFYKINDSVKPLVQEIGLYDLSDTLSPQFIRAFKARNKKDSLSLEKDSITTFHSLIGLAFAGFDRFTQRGNPNVIYSAQVYLDGNKIYSYTMDDIAFDEQRYVNEFAENVHKVKFQKCFLPTLYPPIYKNCVNKARIELTDTLYHHLRLELRDESRNSNSIEFFIRTKKIESYVAHKTDGALVNCNNDYNAKIGGLQVVIPAKTMYYSIGLKVENKLERSNDLYLMPADVNLRNAISIGLAVPKKLVKGKDKLVLDNNGSVYVPVQRNDSLIFQVRNFGSFKLKQDTLSPFIKTQFSPKKIKRLKNLDSFSFIIRDYLSGIASYKLFINNTWQLAEFDAKSSLLTYFFDAGTPPGNLDFRVEVIDRVGNRSEYRYLLRR